MEKSSLAILPSESCRGLPCTLLNRDAIRMVFQEMTQYVPGLKPCGKTNIKVDLHNAFQFVTPEN